MFDFTDILAGTSGSYGLRVTDSKDPGRARLLGYQLIDVREKTVNNELVDIDIPIDNTVYTANLAYPDEPEPLVAVASASPTSGRPPLTVTFTGGGSSGAIDSYEWDFDDGSPTAYGSSVVHTCSAVGTYNATLTVIQDSGGVASSDQVVITVTRKK